MKRAVILGSVAATLLAACGSSNNTTTSQSAAAGSATPATLKPLSLNVALPFNEPPPICCIPSETAKFFGYFDKLNLTVNFQPSVGSAIPMQQLVAGKVDLAEASPSGAFGAMVQSPNVRYIGGALMTKYKLANVGLLFGATSGINSAKDLKGHTVGITTGANPTDPNYVIVHNLLTEAGMSDSDVTYVVAGGQTQRGQALIAGRVDFTGIGAEFAGPIKATAGLHVLTIAPPASQYQDWGDGVSWWTTTDAMSNPDTAEAIQRYVTGSLQATRKLVTDEPFFDQAVNHFNASLATQSASDKSFVWNWQKKQWMTNGGYELAQIAGYITNVYYKSINPKASGQLNMANIGDPRFVKAAVTQLGVDKSVAAYDTPQYTP
ncbi:MAG TPA: ABC transporter substrate-binding protein [Candidatus Dormibacteraeota bacterium]|jgi:ABC-type nitrate/sulfonate/bicarbonate transport system substrate-binding protein|nr:ABC transporter substrate-binding protein [Candidatus Dormibacteraeota bacterium]